MGKSQKKKSMRRHNPVRVPDSHLPKGLAAASSSSEKKDAVLPIMQKMESVDHAERKWACVAVSNLIQNDPSTRRLLQGKNVVGALITRLTDAEEEVVLEAAGALRNLCIDGGYDICAEMYNKNVLTPLKALIPKISTTLSQFLDNPKSAPENAKEIVYSLADTVITILWCLSETSNKALNAINNIALIPFLMSFLAAADRLPTSAVTSAAQCLYVLTEDNTPAVVEVRRDMAYVTCLLNMVKLHPDESAPGANKGKGRSAPEDGSGDDAAARREKIRVLACGILCNIAPVPSFTGDLGRDLILPCLEPVIRAVNVQDDCLAVQRLLQASQSSDPQIEKLSLKSNSRSDHRTPEEIGLSRIEERLRTVQLALEVLTGICARLPDLEGTFEGADEQEAPRDAAAAMEDEDMAVEDPVTSAVNGSGQFVPSLMERLLVLIQPQALSFPPLSSQGSPLHPPTTSALSALHISALECLNNMFISLLAAPSDSETQQQLQSVSESAHRIWNAVWTALAAVGTDITSAGQERRQEFWEVAVGVLWGIGNVWRGILVPDEDQVKALMQFCESDANDIVRVKCVGALECLAQHPSSIDANRVISVYLLSMLPSADKDSPMGTEPMLQAVSAIIDIFSDEGRPYDINFRQGTVSQPNGAPMSYLDRLSDSIEGIIRAVRAIDKRKEGGREMRARGEEVRENLEAFIDYRLQLGL